MTQQDTSLVLGGGLAGGMVALQLARAGRAVTLLEKTRAAHDKVCGEFLSGEALQYLQSAGIDPIALGGVRLRTVRLVAPGDRDAVRESPLPFAAVSLTRRVLDEELLRHAAAAGADVQRGATVNSLERADGEWRANVQDSRSFRAANTFLATGKLDLRTWARPRTRHPDVAAFKMYFRLTPQAHRALGDAVELIVFAGGYAGLQPVEDGAANLCLLMETRVLQGLSGGWESVLRHLLQNSPHLAQRIEGATSLLEKPLAASQVPYGHMQRESRDGLWRVGDQAAVIPSFCGDGMSIALHSGALAAESLLQGRSADAYQRTLHRQLALRVQGSTLLSRTLLAHPQVARLAAAFPHLLPAIAALTRVPQRSLLAASGPRMQPQSRLSWRGGQ